MKKILGLLILAAVIYGVYFFVSMYIENKNAWKIEIINAEVNIRELPDATSNDLGDAFLGDVFKVVELYEEDLKFVWYKVEYDKDKFGWISSARQVPYVKEINNPNGLSSSSDDEFILDYERPQITYVEPDGYIIYSTYDLNSINYEHLNIIEDSEYTITHKVFYEAKPVDSDTPQWWIQYFVEDVNGNKKDATQRIEFEVEPAIEDVFLFEDK